MLFDPFEEQFHLPATSVELGNGKSGQKKIVGQKDKILVGVGVVVANATQGLGVVLGRIKALQTNDLIATESCVFVDHLRADTLKVEILAGANDEERQSLFEGVQALEIQVSSIHQVEGTGLYHQLVEDVNLVDFRGRNTDEGRYVAVQIEQSVHLDRSVFVAVTSPGKQRKTQIDGGAVQSVDGLFQIDSETFLGV